MLQTGRITKIISQSAVIGALAGALDELGPILDLTVEQAGLHETEGGVVGVEETAPALDAFKLMVENNYSGVPVVETETGKLLSNISSSDVSTMLRQGRLQSLSQDAMDFVSAVRSHDAGDTKTGKAKAAAITVHKEATLRQVIRKLAATRTHRLYVVDEDHRATGVVSLKDLLHFTVVRIGKNSDWADAMYMKEEFVESL